MVWTGPDDPTEVQEVIADGMNVPTVISERYFDVSGAEHSAPVDGVNIIVRQMSDGTTQTEKVVR